MAHLHEGTVDLDRFTLQERAQRPHEVLDLAERHRALAEHAPRSEATPDTDRDPPRRERLERRDRRRGDEGVPKPWNGDADAEVDLVAVLGDLRERHEDVAVQRRRVVEPDALIAQ